MADFLIQATLSNMLVAAILAIVAWQVQRRVASASLANLLWALVLVKMITPPLFSLPLLSVPSLSNASNAAFVDTASSEAPDPAPHSNASPATHGSTPASRDGSATGPTTFDLTSWSRPSWLQLSWLLIVIWVSVSSGLFLVSVLRITRFHWLLRNNSRWHEGLSRGLASDAAQQLSLRRTPSVYATEANIAPFVWWISGRSVVVVPEHSIRQLSECDLRFVILHEMAHIKRRDHWLRWLEWLALGGLWWCPLMWWARQQLRMSEEMACDELVLEATQRDVHHYANSLLNMAELLTSSAIRPPVVASAINSGGNLEKRLRTMIAERNWKAPLALRLGIAALALCVLPVGLVNAQDFEAVERRLGGAVEAGELTLQQASVMLEALKKSAGSDANRRREVEAKRRREAEARRLYMEDVNAVEAALRAGELSKEDAQKKIQGLRDRMSAYAKKAAALQAERALLDMDAKRRQYMAIAQDMEAAVRAGKLSKSDAEEKLIAVRKDLFGDLGKRVASSRKDDDRMMEAKKRRYEAFTKDIEAAVQQGKLSKADAEKKMIAARNDLFGQLSKKEASSFRKDDDRAIEAKKKRYMDAAKDLVAAVNDGKLSKDDAEKKLAALRKELFGEQREKKEVSDTIKATREMAANRARFLQMQKRMQDAVAAGEISKTDAERKLIAIRDEMFGELSSKESDLSKSLESRRARVRQLEMEIRKRHAEDTAKEIEAAVKAGKLSKEAAQTKLKMLHKNLIDQIQESDAAAKREEQKKLDERKYRYEQATRRIKEAIDAGELSIKDGEKKLIELRKEVWGR